MEWTTQHGYLYIDTVEYGTCVCARVYVRVRVASLFSLCAIDAIDACTKETYPLSVCLCLHLPLARVHSEYVRDLLHTKLRNTHPHTHPPTLLRTHRVRHGRD